MAENSPLKRNRSSPQQYHPYERTGRSPLQGLNLKTNIIQNPRQVKPLPLSLVKNEKDFFSFSGGSSSLFPSSDGSSGIEKLPDCRTSSAAAPESMDQTEIDPRFAMSEVLNAGNQNLKKKQQQQIKLKNEPQTKPAFGIIGGNRRSTSSMGFIPVDQSCTIGGNSDTEIIRFEQEAKPKKFFKSDNPWRTFKSQHGILPSVKPVASCTVPSSSSFSIYVDNPTPPDDHNSSFKENINSENLGSILGLSNHNLQCDVTSGVLGQLQPKGLNSSFTEKFVSRLGLHSGDESLSQEKQEQNLRPVAERRGILTEKFIPLFDYPEYVTEILKYWGRVEKRIRPRPKYMEKQKEISYKMRSILVDWIVEVVSEYEMTEQTLHLTVNYMDRFLSKMNCLRNKLQLIGTTALLIASKFEETHPPETRDFVFVTDEAYTKTQILQMETLMLNVLEFDLMVPTAHDFVTAYCSILKVCSPIKCLAMYLVDLSLLDAETFLDYEPSVIAAAAVVLGRYSFDHIYWDDGIRKLSPHRQKTITTCVRDLVTLFFNAPAMTQTTIYEKYLSVRYCAISQAFIPSEGPWSNGWN